MLNPALFRLAAGDWPIAPRDLSAPRLWQGPGEALCLRVFDWSLGVAGEPRVSLECLAVQELSRRAGHDKAEALTSDKKSCKPLTPLLSQPQHPGRPPPCSPAAQIPSYDVQDLQLLLHLALETSTFGRRTGSLRLSASSVKAFQSSSCFWRRTRLYSA